MRGAPWLTAAVVMAAGLAALAKSNEIRLQVPPTTQPAAPASVPSGFGEELDWEAYFRRITGTETPQDREKRAAREKQAFEDAICKMAPATSTVPATHQPAAQPAESIGFGPVVERVVRVPSAKNDTFLDLETGKLLAYEDSNGPDEPTMSKELSQIYRRARWAKGSGADLCLPPDGRFDKEVTGLTGLDMRIVPTQKPFDRLTPQDAAEALADRDFYMLGEMRRLVGELPAAFLVETREGHLGVVQVAALTDQPPGLKVRYRIAAAPATVPDAPLWITLAPSEESVRSLKELEVLADVWNLNQEAGRSGEWEIRTADNTRRIARLPYNWHISPDQLLPDGKRITGGTHRTGRFGLDESQIRRVGAMEKGDYLLAWYVGGRRCSNVMRFRIDADHHPNALPLLELAEIETGPGRRLPVLVIRARRHAEKDPAPLASEVAFATLNVDGQDRTTEGFSWVGPDGPLRVGGHYDRLIDLRSYTWNPVVKQKEPPIDPDKPHVIFAKVGRDKVQQTPPIRLTYARTLGEAWDLATPKLAPVPLPEASISLSGAVVDLQGQPGCNYEVTLVSEDRAAFREKADGAGKYRFWRIPPGTYKLGCNPPSMGQPALAISGIVIQAGKTVQKDVSLEGKFILAGRVTDADGKPIPKMAVDLSCVDRQAGAEFMDTTQTDEQGRYRLASPLGTVTYIGVNGRRINGNMPRLSAGANPVDFPADKGHFRAAPATQPGGSRLEFRIAPSRSAMDTAELNSCMEWLKAGRVGFWWKGGRIRGRMPNHVWLPIAGELTNADPLVTGEYEGRKYVLVSDKPGQTLLPGEGKDAWGMAKVHATTDNSGRPAVGFELDDRGAELFAAFTKANVGNALAIGVDGKVVSAPVLMSSLGKQGMITGRFSEQEVAALVQALKAGIPPQKSPAAQPAAEAKDSAKPLTVRTYEYEPTLIRELGKMDDMRGQPNDFELIHKRAAELAEQFSKPEEIAKICLQVLLCHACSGNRGAEDALGYAQRASALPMQAVDRSRLFLLWADVLDHTRRGAKGADLARFRKESTILRLRTIQIAEDYKVPLELPPESGRAVAFFTPPEERQAIEKERREYEFSENLHRYRSYVRQHIVYYYSLKPLATEELADLARSILGEGPASQSLLEAVKEEIQAKGTTSDGTSASPSTPPAARLAVDAAEIDRLIGQLGSEKSAEREDAQKVLVKIGLPAVAALQKAASDKDAERSQRAQTALNEIDDKAFGGQADGFQIRLRPLLSPWKTGQTVSLQLQLCNRGQKEIQRPGFRTPEADCHIELDGQWYWSSLPVSINVPKSLLKPGQVEVLGVDLVESWVAMEEGKSPSDCHKKLRLAPGAHVVRVSYGHVISNPVEIEILPAAAPPAAQPAAAPAKPDDELKALRQALARPAQYGLPKESLPAVERLVEIGSAEAVQILYESLRNPLVSRNIKLHALPALGRIGSQEALKAYEDFQAWAAKFPPDRPFEFGPHESPMDHFADQDLAPLVKWSAGSGQTQREFAAFRWGRYGEIRLWLVSRAPSGTWDTPGLLAMSAGDAGRIGRAENLTGVYDAGRLALKGDHIDLTVEPQREADDADKDGVPDAVEVMLGTDPKKADSDGDGTPDGKDSNPLTPRPAQVSEDMEIRQAAFLALFGTSSTHDAANIVWDAGANRPAEIPEWARQEYYGMGGHVLRSQRIRQGIRQAWINITGIDINRKSATEALVTIRDYEGNMAASVHEIVVKKLGRLWVPVSVRMTMIS